MVNNVVVAGRITKDIEVKQFDNSSVGRFTLAVERPKYKDKEKETDFIDCSMWNADKLAQYLTKGKPIAVTGSIQTRNWDDKDGNKRKSVEVKVDRVSFLPDSKRDGQAPAQSSELEDIAFDADSLPF
jgi:single-strand DNA-binding protein